MPKTLRIGTRKSQLALKQANMIAELLRNHVSDLTIEIVGITTEGDQNQHQPLHELGGKSVFIKSIEQALLKGEIDCAVHCLKDVTSNLHNDTELIAYRPAESVSDCIIMTNGHSYKSLADLPQGCSIATSSLRRQLLLNHLRPDIVIKPIRGNVDTRIANCQAGYADGLMLAKAGLVRLQRDKEISLVCDPSLFTPAPGQGVIVIQKNRLDTHLNTYLSILNDEDQQVLSQYEQAIIVDIGLSCDYPLGVYAQKHNDQVVINACWSTKACTTFNTQTISGTTNSINKKITELSNHIKKSLLS